MGSSIVLKCSMSRIIIEVRKIESGIYHLVILLEDIELNNISLHIYQGEALAIIGEPGASKTLLGRIILVTLNLIEVKLINRSLLIMVI